METAQRPISRPPNAELRAEQEGNGYILRKRGAGYLITDLNGIPVHQAELTPYSLILEDVRELVAVLCDE